GTDLRELVDGPQGAVDVREADAGVEALGDLPVVHGDADRGDRQGGQRLGHDERELDLVVEGQRLRADDVDVGLGELAEATLLGALAPPDLLDLVALEREDELPGVLEDVARERDREVEVEAEAALLRAVVVLEAAHGVDLLGGLPLAQQLLDGLDGARLDAGEAVELEGATQDVEDVRLDGALGGKPLGEA